MPAAFYFFDKNGQEIADHPFQGISMRACGSALTLNGLGADNDHDAPIWYDRRGRFARTSITGYDFTTCRRTEITAEDFGMRHVLVKAWTQTAGSEWFWLVPAKNRANSKMSV